MSDQSIKNCFLSLSFVNFREIKCPKFIIFCKIAKIVACEIFVFQIREIKCPWKLVRTRYLIYYKLRTKHSQNCRPTPLAFEVWALKILLQNLQWRTPLDKYDERFPDVHKSPSYRLISRFGLKPKKWLWPARISTSRMTSSPKEEIYSWNSWKYILPEIYFN